MAKRRVEREQFRPRAQSFRPRQVGGRAEKRRSLVVCGGETEEWYFLKFRAIVRPVNLRVCTNGVDPQTLVRWAKSIKQREEINGDFDAVWCVFDRDDFGSRYEQAHEDAMEVGFSVAASNPCFELWFVLHFRQMQQSITTAECCRLWEKTLGRPYSKTDSSLFEKLQPLQHKAVKHANALLEQQEKPSHNALCSPSTTVHKLIADLAANGER